MIAKESISILSHISYSYNRYALVHSFTRIINVINIAGVGILRRRVRKLAHKGDSLVLSRSARQQWIRRALGDVSSPVFRRFARHGVDSVGGIAPRILDVRKQIAQFGLRKRRVPRARVARRGAGGSETERSRERAFELLSLKHALFDRAR